jgi:hypothetical protein
METFRVRYAVSLAPHDLSTHYGELSFHGYNLNGQDHFFDAPISLRPGHTVQLPVIDTGWGLPQPGFVSPRPLTSDQLYFLVDVIPLDVPLLSARTAEARLSTVSMHLEGTRDGAGNARLESVENLASGVWNRVVFHTAPNPNVAFDYAEPYVTLPLTITGLVAPAVPEIVRDYLLLGSG